MSIGNIINGSYIITDKGYKEIGDINIGDLVYTHMGRFRKVTKVAKKRYKGNVLSIKVNGVYLPTKVTEDTPIYTYTGDKSSRNLDTFSWIPAKDLNLSNMIVFSCGETSEDYTETKYADFLGIFMLRGFIDSKNRINLNTENKEEIIYAIQKTLNTLNIEYSEFNFNNIKYFVISNPKLLKLCENFGSKCDRFIPESIINSSITFLKEFIKHFIISNKDKRGTMYFRATSSLTLLLGYQRILIRLNGFSNVYKCLSRNKDFDYFVISLNKSELFRVGKSSSNVWFRNYHNAFLRVDEISTELYNGEVYMLEVEEDNSYNNHLITVKGYTE